MIPVVMIHKGYQDYLRHTVLQACKRNNVTLISDIKPENYIFHPNFHFSNSREYTGGFQNFEDNYVHMNTTPHDFEVFCFHRWFILKNYMEKFGLGVVFYIDSDVLLYSNVENEWEKFNQYDMTLIHRTAAVSSYMTIKGVTNFCNMIKKIYADKESYDFLKLKSHYDTRQRCRLPGGVCDMTLFDYFHYHSEHGGGPGRVGEMMGIINNSTYDHNINAEDQDFAFENNMKAIEFIEGSPYVFNKKLNCNVLFNSIHCQGGAKALIKGFYEQSN